MKALILAAGLGKRLGLEEIPKPMYEINGKPVLEQNIMLLKKHNIHDICINLHYKPDVIKNYFSDGAKWGVKITYSYEKELLGTSGALKNIESFFDKDPFFVIYGDNYTDIDFTDMLKFHNKHKPITTISVFDPEKSLNSKIAGGVVVIDDNYNLVSFIEGGKVKTKGYVNAGAYIVEPEILDFIPKNQSSDFGNNIFPLLLIKGYQIKAYITKSFVLAIDTKDALNEAFKVLTERGVINDNN